MSIRRFDTATADDIVESDDGPLVRYADHVAAVEQEAAVWHASAEYAIREQAEAMRSACIAAVEGMVIVTVGNSAATVDQVLKALREVQP